MNVYRPKQKTVIVMCLLVLLGIGGGPITTKADALRNIEIFDIQAGRVVTEVESKQDFQTKAGLFLNNITSVYQSVNPLPREGYMIRVPLDPPVEINNRWIRDLIDEVVILYSTEESPYLLLFDNENRSHFFHFEGDATSFIAEVQTAWN